MGEIVFALQDDVNNTVSKHCSSSFKELLTHFTAMLSEEIEKGLRDENDWSMHVDIKSHCEHCKMLISFLKSKTEIKKIWSIAQDYRSHISDVLRDFGLPIQISVEKKGSPYKLILEKTNQLYQMDKNRFEKLIQYNERLKNKKVVIK